MRIFLLSINALFFLFLSCASVKRSQRISFKYYEGARKKKVTLSIPLGGRLMKIVAGGEGDEYRYRYSDSSVIYLSSLGGSETMNTSLIRKSGHYDRWFLSDTASFMGVDDKGNFWKEVKRNKLVYGYANVSSNERPVFEKALMTLK